MPIYEYRCQSCGQQFEKFFRSMRQVAAEVRCPACQGNEVQRLVSAAAIHSRPPGSALETAAQESGPAKPPVFGRKELNQALETKKQLREQAAAD
ncbi:MAG: zinc ribbon domain-containing protein [Anaerolineae bacterium]|nr:zinc ribbon domain-containing protein [Anaerolineae bacterium]